MWSLNYLTNNTVMESEQAFMRGFLGLGAAPSTTALSSIGSKTDLVLACEQHSLAQKIMSDESDMIKPPPASWKPWLKGDMRNHTWKYIAGNTPDGREKPSESHAEARMKIRKREETKLMSKVDLKRKADVEGIWDEREVCVGRVEQKVATF
jgi:hypothetical protein